MRISQRLVLRAEQGTTLVESLLAFGLLALVFTLGVQAFAYAHARSVATAAAQDGAEAAAAQGPDAGTARAAQVLAAAGGIGRRLHASASEDALSVTVDVDGEAPGVFPLSLILPAVHARARLPLEQYAPEERR
jgi:hypothetical protein